jgi:phosphopantetheinyl transferase
MTQHDLQFILYAGFGRNWGLEFVKPIPEMQALVDQYFSVAERFRFRSPDLKLKAFYSCWTRKEA